MARPRQVSDEAIFDAVREAVEEHGHKVSTTVIAAKVGLSQAALFKRFGTKEDLLVQGLTPKPPLELFALFAGGPDEDRALRPQLLEVATAMHQLLSEMMPRIHALRSCGYLPENIFKNYDVPPPVIMLQAVETWFTVGQERGLVRPGADSRALAKSLIGSLFFHSHIHRLVGEWLNEPEPDAYVVHVVDILCDGIELEAA